jgi:hypothetical protein
VARASDLAVLRFELTGYLRGGLPLRLLSLLPAAAFLAAWTWTVASPFAAVVWLACLALEPRLNNMFCGSPHELEAFSILPARWERIVLIKNLTTAGIAAVVLAVLSVVTLYFSPESPTPGRMQETMLYLPTVFFPLLILGNEASARHPRPGGGTFSRGIPDALRMSATLLVLSVPWLIITGLLERPWLAVPYAALAAASWFFGSVPRTAERLLHQREVPWQRTETSSNS